MKTVENITTIAVCTIFVTLATACVMGTVDGIRNGFSRSSNNSDSDSK